MHQAQTQAAQKAKQWLAQQGLQSVQLTPLSGHTNHVFKVEHQYTHDRDHDYDHDYDHAFGIHKLALHSPRYSVIRLANISLKDSATASGCSLNLCPLNTDTQKTIQKHQCATQLGLAPELLAFSLEEKVMWQAYAGQTTSLQLKDFEAINQQLSDLHRSKIDVSFMPTGYTDTETNCLEQTVFPTLQQLLNEGTSSTPSFSYLLSQHLLSLAHENQYAKLPLVPIHSDLNPGNWLHDGKRWWLIDWDFATVAPKEWDYASIITEHNWPIEWARQFVPQTPLLTLSWFCCCFALLSYLWHQARQSSTQLLAVKQKTVSYWARQIGFNGDLSSF